MPDLLGVTNPVPGHDNTNITNRNIPISPGNSQDPDHLKSEAKRS